MTKRDDVKRLADDALAAMGRVDILVNNAGSNTPQPIDQITDEDWDRIVELNLTLVHGPDAGAGAADEGAPLGPRSSTSRRSWAWPRRTARNVYSATKSGPDRPGPGQALDLGPYGITVNCIAPGPFLTDLPGSLLSPEQKKVVRRSHGPGPLGRAARAGRPGPAAGQRRRQLHHRRRARRRRRLDRQDVLRIARHAGSRRHRLTSATAACRCASG